MLAKAVSMKCARHSPQSVSVHLRYGQLTVQDQASALDGASEVVPCGSAAATAVPLDGAAKVVLRDLHARIAACLSN